MDLLLHRLLFHRLLIIAVLLFTTWTRTTRASPFAASDSGAIVSRTDPSNSILQRISIPHSLSTTRRSNAIAMTVPPSSSLLPLPPIGDILCFDSQATNVTTNVEGCRPTLNYFRTFPAYRKVQPFLEGRYPKLPSKPPYAVHHVRSNCAVQIAARYPTVEDRFSFEQARALAMRILESCAELEGGGRGGVAPIAQDIGWKVAVVGFRRQPQPPVTGVGGIGNGTVLVGIDEA